MDFSHSSTFETASEIRPVTAKYVSSRQGQPALSTTFSFQVIGPNDYGVPVVVFDNTLSRAARGESLAESG